MSAGFFTGLGQIMLQQSALTGALFLAGLCAHSRSMAFGAVIGAFSGIMTARLRAFDPDDISHGLYGFNSALVGIALSFTYSLGVSCGLLIVLGSALSSILMCRMLRRADSLPPLTMPFVLSTWIMLAVGNILGLEPAGFESVSEVHGDLAVILRGLGQVMFQESWITGILFLIGLIFHSRQAAAWAWIGSAMGLVVARGLSYPESLVDAGIFGFNGVLVGIALGDTFRNNVMVTLGGMVLSVLLLRGFQLAGIPALTAPFVLSTWTIILLDRWRR